MQFELEGLVYDTSSYERENGMGLNVVYRFDSEDNCECLCFNKIIKVTEWIREHPIRIFDSDEIDVFLFENDEK